MGEGVVVVGLGEGKRGNSLNELDPLSIREIDCTHFDPPTEEPSARPGGRLGVQPMAVEWLVLIRPGVAGSEPFLDSSHPTIAGDVPTGDLPALPTW